MSSENVNQTTTTILANDGGAAKEQPANDKNLNGIIQGFSSDHSFTNVNSIQGL